MKNFIFKSCAVSAAMIGTCAAAIILGGCTNTEKIAKEASAALTADNYPACLQAVLELNDNQILENDSLMAMLTTAYYHLKPIDSTTKTYESHDIDISPDGKHVVTTAYNNKSISIFAYPSMQVEKEIQLSDSPYSSDISPNGKMMAVAMDNGDIELYEFPSGTKTKTFNAHSWRCRDVEFVNDSILYSCGNDQYVRAWNVNSGKMIDEDAGAYKNIKSVKSNKGGSAVISASNDGTSRVYNSTKPDSFECTAFLQHGTNYVNSAAISDDGKKAITVSGDQRLKVWDVDTHTADYTLEFNDAMVSVGISPDGKLAAAAGTHFITIFNLETGKEIARLPLNGYAMWELEFVDNNHIIGIANTNILDFKLLSNQELIENARKLSKTLLPYKEIMKQLKSKA